MRYASPSSFHILGWKPEEMIGKGPDDFVLAEDMPVLTAAIVRILSPDVQNETATVRMRKKDGSTA
jgi:PAS domain S-box-containing protein